MNRTNSILSALLLGQMILFGMCYAFCGEDQTMQSSRVVLLKGIERQNIQGLRIEKEDGTGVNLARKDGKWVLPDQAGYLADDLKVDRLLGTLLGMESSYVVSTGTDHHVELKVAADQFERKVTIETANEKKLVLVGKAGSGGFTYLRLDPAPEVYAVDDIKTWELGTRVADWARKDYVVVDRTRLARLEIKTKGQSLVLSRTALDAWQVNGQPAKADAIKPLIDKAVKIDLSDIAGLLSDSQLKYKVDQSADAVLVSLALTKDPLPATAPPPSPPAAEGTEGTAPQAAPAEAPAAPEIVETKVLHFAQDPEKSSAYLLYAEDATHVVLVDQWRIKPLLEAEAAKLSN